MNAEVIASSLGPGHLLFAALLAVRLTERRHQREAEDLHLRRGAGSRGSDDAVAARGEVDKARSQGHARAIVRVGAEGCEERRRRARSRKLRAEHLDLARDARARADNDVVGGRSVDLRRRNVDARAGAWIERGETCELRLESRVCRQPPSPNRRPRRARGPCRRPTIRSSTLSSSTSPMATLTLPS